MTKDKHVVVYTRKLSKHLQLSTLYNGIIYSIFYHKYYLIGYNSIQTSVECSARTSIATYQRSFKCRH